MENAGNWLFWGIAILNCLGKGSRYTIFLGRDLSGTLST
jgi:hypothetical protein